MVLLFVPAWSWAGYFPTEFDPYFKEAEIVYPYPDWRMEKAQAWQESRLNPDAVSPVGAKYLMQIMPATEADLRKRYPQLSDPVWSARVQIMAGALYMRQVYKQWNNNRTIESHFKLCLAGYNAGNGYLFKAQRLCGGPQEYEPIIKCLPDVPRVDYQQPIDYVNKIYNRWYPALRAGL